MYTRYDYSIDNQYNISINRCDMLEEQIKNCTSLLLEYGEIYQTNAVKRKRMKYYNQLMHEFGAINADFILLSSITPSVPFDSFRGKIIDDNFNKFNTRMTELLGSIRSFGHLICND